MELRQVSYFKSVAECGSFARASEKIHIAQPAISHQISKLEARLGTKLFIRHARGIRLTESGRLFLAHASKILACIDDAQLAIRAELKAGYRHSEDDPHGSSGAACATEQAAVSAARSAAR